MGHLSSMAAVCLLCVCWPFHVKTKPVVGEKKLKKRRLNSIYWPIKLSMCPVWWLLWDFAVTRGTLRQQYFCLKLEMLLEICLPVWFPCFHFFPSIPCFLEIRTKCKISNPLRCCSTLQASLFCCDWMMLRLNDLWESRGFAVSLELRHIAALWRKARKEDTEIVAARRYERSLSPLLLCCCIYLHYKVSSCVMPWRAKTVMLYSTSLVKVQLQTQSGQLCVLHWVMVTWMTGFLVEFLNTVSLKWLMQ